MKKGVRQFVLNVIGLLALLGIVSAADPNNLVANSQDWKDVYSVVMYGNFMGISSAFLVSDRHGPLLLNNIPKENNIWLFTSSNAPFIRNYPGIIEADGRTVEEFQSNNINLEIAKRLNSTKFIILDDSYGYNAISIASYAVVTRSYVLFADRRNIGGVLA